jgi:hypothetical protein
VTTVVCRVLLDLQDFPERMENQAKTDAQANLECPADPHQTANPQFLPHARNAHQVHLDPLDPKENQATPAQEDNPEIQDPTERQEAPALLDPKAHLVALDPKAHLEMPEPQPLQPQPPLATLVHKETQAHKVLPDLLEALERTLNLALKDPLDHQANLEATASLEPLDLRDQRDLLDPKENVVFARNIAPWTVEFSSKMEHGDKNFDFPASPNYFFAISLQFFFLFFPFFPFAAIDKIFLGKFF